MLLKISIACRPVGDGLGVRVGWFKFILFPIRNRSRRGVANPERDDQSVGRRLVFRGDIRWVESGLAVKLLGVLSGEAVFVILHLFELFLG